MKDIIEKIISIDQSARDHVRDQEHEIRTREERTKQEISLLKKQLLDQAEKQGQAYYDEKVRAAQAEALLILKKSEEQIRAVEEHYLSIKGDMTKKLFSMIFFNNGEGKSG